MVMFCDGATTSRAASRASSAVFERMSPIAAPMERSSAVSAVQASVATCPGGVIAEAPKASPGMTGPCRLRRSVTVTDSAPLPRSWPSRLSNLCQPAGVRYWSGSSGFSFSI